jgi:hypothetical protein
MTTDHTKTPIPKLVISERDIINQTTINCKDLENLGHMFNAKIKEIENLIIQRRCKCSPSSKKRKRESTVNLKEENKKRKISKVPCPCCGSWETTAFLYSWGKEGWIYACREQNMNGVSDRYCGHIWIESDKTLNYRCKCGSSCADIDIRYEQPGYCCTQCGRFEVF